MTEDYRQYNRVAAMCVKIIALCTYITIVVALRITPSRKYIRFRGWLWRGGGCHSILLLLLLMNSHVERPCDWWCVFAGAVFIPGCRGRERVGNLIESPPSRLAGTSKLYMFSPIRTLHSRLPLSTLLRPAICRRVYTRSPFGVS